MAYNVFHYVDPRTLGKAAEATGAAGTKLDNQRASLEAAQRAGLQGSQIAANQDMQAASQAFQGQQREADRNFDAQKVEYGTAVEDAWRKRALEYTSQQQQQHDAAVSQQIEKRNRAEFVQQGLKDGTLYHDPKMNEQLATIQRERATTMADPSISDDVKQRMLAQYDQAFDAIYSNPQVNTKPQVTLAEQAQGKVLVYGKDGQPKPLGTQEPGDMILTTDRSGAFRPTFAKAMDNKPASVLEQIATPEWQSKRLGEIHGELKSRADAQHAGQVKLAEKKLDMAKAKFEAALANPDADPKPFENAYLDAEKAFEKLVTNPPTAPTARDALLQLDQELSPPAEQRQTMEFRNDRDEGRTQTQEFVNGRDEGVMTPLNAQQGPVRVNSEAEAESLPKGTTVILNGVVFRVN